jgi:hypothetical protein
MTAASLSQQPLHAASATAEGSAADVVVDEKPASPQASSQPDDASLHPPSSSSSISSAAAAPLSPSSPSPDYSLVPSTPVFSSSSRGYIAYVYWAHFPPASSSSSWRPPKRSPSHTELVPSIPTLFFRLFALLSDAERQAHHRSVYAAMDKKLLKATGNSVPASAVLPLSTPASPAVPTSLLSPHHVPLDSLDATRLLLREPTDGSEYIVTACRKEHVRLLYEGEAAVLNRLQLCPMLLDVYSLQGGKKTLVGGAGIWLRQRGGGMGWECQCSWKTGGAWPPQHDEVTQQAEDGPEDSAMAGTEAEADGKTERSEEPEVRREDDAAMQEDGVEAASSDAMLVPLILEEGPAPAAAPLSSSSSSAVPAAGSELDAPLFSSEQLLEADDSSELPGLRTPTASAAAVFSQPSRVSTAASASSSTAALEAGMEKLRKRVLTLQRQLTAAQDALKSVTAMSGLWEAKYKEEKDVNVKLWSRVVLVQRQLRQMTRPLTQALAAQGRL